MENLGEGSRPRTLVDEPKSRLILPDWDVPPFKHVHASHDLITLLHLEGQYNTYVKPFADPNLDASGGQGGNAANNAGGNASDAEVKHEDGIDRGTDRANGLNGVGNPSAASIKKKLKKKRRLERGYAHLLEDVMDPTPLGERPHATALLPLLADAWLPPGRAPDLPEEDVQMLPVEMFQIALLEPGQRQDGYSLGRKHGVAEAEERRRRKHARHSQSIAPPELPSPDLSSPHHQTPSGSNTPLLPVQPPSSLGARPSFPINTTRRPAHSARPSFSNSSGHASRRPSMSSAPGAYRSQTGPPGTGSTNAPGGNGGLPPKSPHRPFMRPGSSFTSPRPGTGGGGGGMPFRSGGASGSGGAGGGRPGSGYRHPSFGRAQSGPDGSFTAGHKRGRESVNDPRDAKRSRE